MRLKWLRDKIYTRRCVVWNSIDSVCRMMFLWMLIQQDFANSASFKASISGLSWFDVRDSVWESLVESWFRSVTFSSLSCFRCVAAFFSFTFSNKSGEFFFDSFSWDLRSSMSLFWCEIWDSNSFQWAKLKHLYIPSVGRILFSFIVIICILFIGGQFRECLLEPRHNQNDV